MHVTDPSVIDFFGVNLHALAFNAVRRPQPDSADRAQARQLAAELDVEIGSLRIILSALEVRRRTIAVRNQMSASRHELAALLVFRHRLRDRFGI